MTIERKREPRLLSRRSPKRAREVAAARLERRTLVVLEEALAKSGLSQAKIADELDVTPGRISQIFGAETNLTLATVARILAAMGYEAVLSAVSTVDGSRIEPRMRVGRRSLEIDAYHQTYISGAVERPRIVFVPAGESPDSPSVGESSLIGRAIGVTHSDFRWMGAGKPQFTATPTGVLS